jgi:hypothetical protein
MAAMENRNGMFVKRQDALRTIWRSIVRSTVSLLPALSADEQTRGSWAKLIETYPAVPQVYRDFFDPFLAQGQAFPYTVLTPSYEGFFIRTTENLVCQVENETWILERSGEKHLAKCYPQAGISYVEVQTVLLDSRIKITGVTKSGVPDSSTIRFNSVTDYLLTPIVERIRLAGFGSREATSQSEREKFDQWVRLNFKFMNYAKKSLLEGEKVVQAILQPEIRAKLLAVLGKTYYRTISPTLVSILTDRELIFIREEERHGGEDKYGGIWDYVPLNKIKTISLKERNGSLLVLAVELPENVLLEYVFQATVKEEIDRMLELIGELNKS